MHKSLQFSRSFKAPADGSMGAFEVLETSHGSTTYELDVSCKGPFSGQVRYRGNDDDIHLDPLEAGYNILSTSAHQTHLEVQFQCPGGASVQIKVFILG